MFCVKSTLCRSLAFTIFHFDWTVKRCPRKVCEDLFIYIVDIMAWSSCIVDANFWNKISYALEKKPSKHYTSRTWNSGTVSSIVWRERLLPESSTVSSSMTKGELRFLQRSDMAETPIFHSTLTSWNLHAEEWYVDGSHDYCQPLITFPKGPTCFPTCGGGGGGDFRIVRKHACTFFHNIYKSWQMGKLPLWFLHMFLSVLQCLQPNKLYIQCCGSN